jgi:hypothetical protein
MSLIMKNLEINYHKIKEMLGRSLGEQDVCVCVDIWMAWIAKVHTSDKNMLNFTKSNRFYYRDEHK